MKILFVDDEPKILQGITRSIFHLLDEWEVETASSGREALEILADNDFDVLVTDMRMPGMDGAELLVQVHKRFPDVVRIVLSGHTELEAALRVVPVAHQFLTKPCGADELQAVIERALNLRGLLCDESLRTLVGHITSLPAVPRLYSKLTAALVSDTSLQEVGALIESDPAMCVKVLQLVNSSFFSTARTITDVKQAVNRLGLRMIKNLALMVEVFSAKSIPGISAAKLEAQAKHGLQVGTLASQLVQGQVMKDDAFMAGLLHDVGKLVLWGERPALFQEVEALCAVEGMLEHEAEQRLLSSTHAEVGGYLVGVWGLPYRIAEAVALHHRPSVPHGNTVDLLAATYISNELISRRRIEQPYLDQVGATPEMVGSWVEQAETIAGTGTGDAA